MTDLDNLKQQADDLGIGYRNNISETTLQKKIDDHLQTTQTAQDALATLKQDNFKLVKVIVTPMDATKRNYQGDLFSAGNDVLGTVTKYVPYNTEWLAPEILVKMLEEKELQIFQSKRNDKGIDVVTSKDIKQFSIQRLPQPTKEELAELAKIQQARQSVEEV